MGAAGMGLLLAWLASTTWNLLTGMTIGVLLSNKSQTILGIDTGSASVHVDVEWLNDELAVHVWNVAGRVIERAIEWLIESAVVVRGISRA
ncbi:hypothetical protein [Rhodococcus sp. P1Y]|uniref:hypothetical protein n=1 Tax=Rhodococcus sp. P1Y TaxID=1302308 RepID=UPI001293C2F7|nr:hypothetical protein [Rhodococcus sp. P1Y]